MIDERRAIGFGISAVLLWSTVATAFKLTLEQFTPIQMLTIASFVSALTLIVICFLQGKLDQFYFLRETSERRCMIQIH